MARGVGRRSRGRENGMKEKSRREGKGKDRGRDNRYRGSRSGGGAGASRMMKGGDAGGRRGKGMHASTPKSKSYKGGKGNRVSVKGMDDASERVKTKGKGKGSVAEGTPAATDRGSTTRRSISVESQRERRNKVKTALVDLGRRIYHDLDNGIFPEVHIPSRSVANIVYDKRLRQYVLGNARIVRSAKNIRHLRPFTQLIWLAFFVDKLVNEGKTSTLRDVYYSAQAFNIDFEDQAESDHIITDLEALLSLAREDFNIYPEERSSIFGDLTIEYTVPGYEGRRLNLSDHPDGYLIGPSLSSAEFIDTSAEMVLAVEKGGIFTRFVEENVHERFKAIIVDTAGQAPRSTRYLLMRLNRELNLPVYILTDGDVYGEHIAMVIKSGSANAAHLRELTVPDAKWIGVWASDIQRYRLPTDPMTEQDVKRCHELKQDPRYQSDIWKSELELFMKMKRKSELEAFAKYGLTKITDDYLPEK
ncbi:MAG: DNA topoisomerase IV subunit A, partial [Candidatus Nitrosocaldus sp.]|nr:DNA topoisomerase IV subunit A [Candidatus Nitrosocaldus sp.]